LASKKKAAERRFARPTASLGGGTTRCSVERQRSFVHCAVMSPKFTSSAPGSGVTACQLPSGASTSRPGTGSAHSTVTTP